MKNAWKRGIRPLTLVLPMVILPASFSCRRTVPESQQPTTQPTTESTTTAATQAAATQPVPVRTRRSRLHTGLAGAWNGTLSCETTQVLGQSETPPSNRPLILTVAFNEENMPIKIPVVGFLGAPMEYVSISQPGQTEEVQSAKGDLSITSNVEITAAEYSRDAFSVQMDIDYAASGGPLEQSGTGTQILEGQIEDGVLRVTLSVDYAVLFTTGANQFDAGERKNCSGTLVLR